MVEQPHQTRATVVVFSCLAVVVILLFQISSVGNLMSLVDAEVLPAASAPAVFDEVSQIEKLVEAVPKIVGTQRPKYHSYTAHNVESGDSLYWIAASYGISVQELKSLNGLESDVIKPGQRLVVPLDFLKYYPVGVRLSNAEVEWLAQMIHAEARGEPYLGQVAVGAVILNRMLSSQFPNTLRGVLFQRNAFQPILNGSFYNTPSESARKAAFEALSGHDPTGGALFFFNPRQSSDRFMHSRPAKLTIGSHRFTN